jgi:hypothetical protein
MGGNIKSSAFRLQEAVLINVPIVVIPTSENSILTKINI